MVDLNKYFFKKYNHHVFEKNSKKNFSISDINFHTVPSIYKLTAIKYLHKNLTHYFYMLSGFQKYLLSLPL